MAIKATQVPITREQMYEILQAYGGTVDPTDQAFKDYLTQELTSLTPDMEVDVSERTDFEGPTVGLVDYVLLDLASYGY